MSCCGKSREQFTAGPPSRPYSGRVTHPALPQPQQALQSRVFFEYMGRTGMTVIGRATGKQYRFDRPGARLEVDLRDRSSMAAVPNVRQLSPGDFRTAR
jgi:hypothetical protein